MPQLLPDPWFLVFSFAWIMLILILPKKIISHKILNEPSPKKSSTTLLTWTWPWT